MTRPTRTPEQAQNEIVAILDWAQERLVNECGMTAAQAGDAIRKGCAKAVGRSVARTTHPGDAADAFIAVVRGMNVARQVEDIEIAAQHASQPQAMA